MKTIPLSGGRTARAGRTTVAALALQNFIALANAFGDPALVPDAGDLRPGVIALANEARFTETYYSEPLTNYGVGFRDPNNIDATLEFFAPEVPTSRRFEFKKAANAEEFLSETDDLRAIGASFKSVEYTGTSVNEKTLNKGLTIVVDLDNATAGWEQRTVAKLIRRLKRNELRRAIALLSAAATNTAKTWDTTAGKDPDQDVLSDLVTAATASGISPNRVGYGHTAWTKRRLSLRAQNLSGQAGSAGMNEAELAGFLGVDQVLVSKERYQSGAAAKTEVVNNLVLMFAAMSGADTEDPSNIKRFISPVEGGGYVRVYVQQISAKLVAITVEHYSNIVITSTLGIRKFTVS
jgi:hypothetical protein